MKKFVWLISCLMILSLMVVSCGGEEEAGGTVTTEDQGQTVTVGGDEGETPAGNGGESTVVPSGEPQYGGTLSVVTPGDVMGFDELTTPDYWDVVGHLTCDELLEGDWARGPAGTGEFSWATNDVYRWDSKSGALAESFEIIEPGHVILNIRHGVHFCLLECNSLDLWRRVAGSAFCPDDG
jgi:hypothetical protein